MALSAQLTADVESVTNRVLALYERLVNCDSSSVTCATIPNILRWPFSANAGHIYLQRSRLLQIHLAVMDLFSDYAIRRGFMTAADCAGSVVPTEAVAVCRTLADVSLSKLEQPRDHAFSNNQWLANLDLVVSAIEGLFSEENPCPDEICAPCTCPCEGTWPPASWPCGGLVEVYTLAAGSYIEVENYNGLGQTWRWQAVNDIQLTAYNSCSWDNNTTATTQTYIDGTPIGSPYSGWWEVVLEGCEWRLYEYNGSGGTSVPKTTGQSPVGDYQSWQSGGFQINTNASIS